MMQDSRTALSETLSDNATISIRSASALMMSPTAASMTALKLDMRDSGLEVAENARRRCQDNTERWPRDLSVGPRIKINDSL